VLFYERYDVQECYVFDPDTNDLQAFIRGKAALVPAHPGRDFVSPRLGIRFDRTGPQMVMRFPDGGPFFLSQELEPQLRAAQKRADDEHKRADDAQKRADDAKKRADEEQKRADDALKRAEDERKRADEQQKRADDEKKRAEDERQRANEALDRAEDERRQAIEGLLEALEARLEAKFQQSGLALMPRLRQVSDPDRLAAILRAVRNAASLDDVPTS
jgi:hypothetical protein